MIDLGKQKIEITCPKCNFANPVSLKQIQIRDVIICRGCKSNIQLHDYLNTVKKTLKTFRREMGALMNAFEDIRNITLEL